MFDNERAMLESQRKWVTFCRNYVSLPLLVVNLIGAFALTFAGQSQSAMAFIGLSVLSFVSYILNNTTLNRIDEILADFDGYEKERRIKDLNPHK